MSERERIEHLINLYMLTPSQFADKTGIQRASLSHILKNRNKPSLEIMLKIYHTFPEVELAWLVAGEGEPPKLPEEDDNSEGEDVTESDIDNDSVVPTTLFPSFMEEIPVQPVAEKIPASKQLRNQVVAENSDTVETPRAVNIPYRADTDDVNASCTVAVSDVTLKSDNSKRVKEIKLFYNDGTYDTFVPENL